MVKIRTVYEMVSFYIIFEEEKKEEKKRKKKKKYIYMSLNKLEKGVEQVGGGSVIKKFELISFVTICNFFCIFFCKYNFFYE